MLLSPLHKRKEVRQQALAARREAVLDTRRHLGEELAADQAVKLQVRDAILACMEPGDSAKEAEAFVRDHGAELLQAAEDVLRERGFSYSAQLMLGDYAFPDRIYGDTLYPAGTYRALRVVLGEGAGQNWWCVLFPPLCIVTGDAQELPALEEISFHSSLLDWLREWGVIA